MLALGNVKQVISICYYAEFQLDFMESYKLLLL